MERVLLLFTLLIGLAALTSHVYAQDANTKRLVEVPISAAPAISKRALVIGVDDYQNVQKLSDCGHDALDFAALLKTRFGFDHVTVMTDAADLALRPTYTNVRHQLNVLLGAVVPDKTELVLFFSGHGTRGDGDADWLVPEDGDPMDVSGTCLNYTQFKSRLDQARPARALLVMDACRSLLGGKGVGGSGFGGSALALGPQVAELQSCQPTQISQEGVSSDFHESVFTHFLIKGLSGDPDAAATGTQTVTFDSLKTYVQQEVSQYVADKFSAQQLPDGRATLGGMVLAKVSAVSAIVPPPTVIPPVTPSAPVTPSVGTTKVNPKDGAVMMYVPAGLFPMGDDDQDDNPRHMVRLSGYWIYKNDVTVAMYRKFCQSTGKQMPSAPSWAWKDDHPMVNMTWDDAKAYCAWAGVRLPTEAQWEKAARGTDGRKYPWGNEWDDSRLCLDAQSTSSVGSYPSGASPYGCLDMAGNVNQWCSDWYDEDYWKSGHGADPTGPASGEGRVLRGGSGNNIGATGNFRASCRNYYPPERREDDIGFRGVSGL